MAAAETATARSARAKALIEYLTKSADYPYAALQAVSLEDGFDVLDIVVEPELSQHRVVAIRNEEPIRIYFPVDDDHAPRIFARREDFPLDLVHTNYDRNESGRCLCVWEENWNDLKRALTAQALVERIRSWFARTAAGTLHQPGQPLEPMISSTSSTLILPPGPPPSTLHFAEFRNRDGQYILQLQAEPEAGAPSGKPIAIFSLVLPPQVHGALHRRPTTMAALRDLLAPLGVDLVQSFGDWLVSPEQREGPDRIVLLVITLPKRASAKGKVTDWEIWAFQPLEKLFELSERLGRAAAHPETGRPQVLLTPVPCGSLEDVKLYYWRVVQRLDRASARKYSGNKAKKDSRLVGIGAGAIGSTLMSNAVRAGIGPWTIIDDDINLPHNGVRQFQLNEMVGHAKALTAAAMLDAILAEGGNQAIDGDFLNPDDEEAKRIGAALETADLVIDFSASPAVLGALADDSRVARAASFFFSPDGGDLVVLAEDKIRSLRLDEIEAQYFLAAATNPLMAGHLDASRIDFVRYANACQDLTRPLPPWQVQTLCGVGAGRLVGLLREKRPSADLWRLHSASGAVIPLRLVPSAVHRHEFSGFRVTVSDSVLNAMRRLRAAHVPNETGGILLGAFDLDRRVIHVVDALPAPPDSRQTPTYFIRGAKHLKPIVDGIALRSAGVIGYVGEWHSHPDGCAARPSNDDEQVFAYLRTHLDPAGSPYLMAICGEKEVWLRTGWHGLEAGEGTTQHG